MRRFAERIYKFYYKAQTVKRKSQKDLKLERLVHQTIKKVTEDIEEFRFNTAISALMILFNELEKHFSLEIENRRIFIKLLAPFAPHISEELWHYLGNKKSIFLEKWPAYDSGLIEEESFELVIQVNGKVREKVEARAGISQKEAEELVLNLPKMREIIKNAAIKKIIFVPERLMNIVL